jgi:SAM-dependent methyltransferase
MQHNHLSDISAQHKEVKKHTYWDNLVGGGTAAYKEKKIDELLQKHRPASIEHMIDIGCGTCELIFHYQKEFRVKSVTCMDYDKSVIDKLKSKYSSMSVQWRVADVFELGKEQKKYDLVFLLDMIHEVYSFYGRPNGQLSQPIDHALGLTAVCNLLDNITQATLPGGCIIITDNVLSEENKDVRIRLNNQGVIDAIHYFLREYPTRKITANFVKQDELIIKSQDLCVLLTQYNKIKNQNWDRWNVEKMETHQYFSLSEYQNEFSRRGFTVHALVETPPEADLEWREDFSVIEGLSQLPHKRITLLAKKL